jgi:hypothetical protein
MALSTLNPSLPALEDLITLTPRPPPPKKIGPRLTRDIRRDILLLRELNDYEDEAEYTYERIAELLLKRHGRSITQRAIQYTCNKHKATPKKNGRGRKSTLTVEQVDEIEAYIITSRVGRQVTYVQLGDFFHLSPSAIRSALRKRGYSRRITLRKPPISEKNKIERLQWAYEHRH